MLLQSQSTAGAFHQRGFYVPEVGGRRRDATVPRHRWLSGLSFLFACLCLLGCGLASAAGPEEREDENTPRPTSSDSRGEWSGGSDTFLGLVEKIESSTVRDDFEGPLIVGALVGGRFRAAATTPDPVMPDTFEVYFDRWNFLARAHLLLTYARYNSVGGQPTGSTESPEQSQASGTDSDSRDAIRIRYIVREGGYQESWNKFAGVYADFVQDAQADLERRPAGPVGIDVMERVDAIARKNGLHAAVTKARIQPEHVAGEMLRIRNRAREVHGLPSDPTEVPREELFFTCRKPAASSGDADSAPVSDDSVLAVNLRTWHPLAEAFTRALTANERHDSDRAADRIVAAFRATQAKVSAWDNQNPDSTTSAQNAYLRQVASEIGLYQMIESYAMDRELDASNQGGDQQ